MNDDILSYEKKIYVQDYSHTDDYPRPVDVYVVNWKNANEYPNATRVLVVNNHDSYYRREAQVVNVVNHLMIMSDFPPEFVYVVNPNDLTVKSKILSKGYAVCPNCRAKLQMTGLMAYDCKHCMRIWNMNELIMFGRGLNE